MISRAWINPITIKPTFAVLLAALSLGGCDVTSGGGLGEGTGPLARAFSGSSLRSAVGLSDSSAAAAVTNAALGGLVGSKLGASLNDDDRRLAYQAQLAALDLGASGAPVPWRNAVSGHYGNIVPGPAYDRKGAQCRGFSHTITVDGELKTARGTACRGADGVWNAAG